MKIKLAKDEIKRFNKDLQHCFKAHYDWDVLEITDDIYDHFINDLRMWGYHWCASVEDFYDTIDAYKELQETYQTLVYHHELYKKGKTPLDAFIGVCDGLSVDELL